MKTLIHPIVLPTRRVAVALLTMILLAVGMQRMHAIDLSNPKVSSDSDKARIEQLLQTPGLERDRVDRNCALIAEALKGSRGDDYYYSDSIADLRLNPNTFTPITFINTVAALANASSVYAQAGWSDVAKALQDYSCRRGEDNGFSSLMWHASDWIGDNTYRGNVRELTADYSGCVDRTKSLDYLTRHRDRFAVLADSATYEKVRLTEMGFRTHRVPTLKKETIGKKEILEDLRDGDIILLNPGEDGIDIREIGFVINREDGPHMIHYSESAGEVVETEDPLPRYFKLKTKIFNGYRILRMKLN